MTPQEIIDVVQHFANGGKVEKKQKPINSETYWSQTDDPSWNFAFFDFRKAEPVIPAKEVWVTFNEYGKTVSSRTTPPPDTSEFTYHKYVLAEQSEVRNPENIDFDKHPIPEGYRLVTEEDIKCNEDLDDRDWKVFYGGRWQVSPASGENVMPDWTYICPKNWRAK